MRKGKARDSLEPDVVKATRPVLRGAGGSNAAPPTRLRMLRACRWIARGETGQALAWVAVMMPLFLSVVGLAIDGGTVFDARRELQNVADSAARAGAMQIDQGVYRQSSGATVVLDPVAAREAAAEYVSSQGSGFSATITVGSKTVVVQVSRNVSTSFLRLVGISTVHITATAPAAARYGIQGENG